MAWKSSSSRMKSPWVFRRAVGILLIVQGYGRTCSRWLSRSCRVDTQWTTLRTELCGHTLEDDAFLAMMAANHVEELVFQPSLQPRLWYFGDGNRNSAARYIAPSHLRLTMQEQILPSILQCQGLDAFSGLSKACLGFSEGARMTAWST